jgi:predicted nucleic acid-binding protein
VAAPLVVDASAALAVIRSEPAEQAVRDALQAQRSGGGEIVVPDHFWLEVVNALVRRHGYTAEQVVEEIRDLDELDIRSIEIDRAVLLYALSLMGSGLTAYDAAYLAVASASSARLLTLDEGLRAAADAAGVVTVPPAEHGPRVGEERATYGPGVDLARPGPWAGFAGYLGELRRRAEAGGG